MENKELIIDLVTWISKQSRPYEDEMEEWRTSRPRLTNGLADNDPGKIRPITTAQYASDGVVQRGGKSMLSNLLGR